MLARRLSIGCTTNESISGNVVKARHLHLRNDETVLVDRVNDLAGVHICVRFDEGELCLFSACEALARGRVCVVLNLQLSCVDGDDGTDVERGQGQVGWRPLQELSLVFQIILWREEDEG